MKPFDLQAALKGVAVVTKGGRNVKDIAYFPSSRGSFKVKGVVDGEILSWTVEGSYYKQREHVFNDLIMAPVKRTVWVNLYAKDITDCAYVYDSEDEADQRRYRIGPDVRLGKRSWPLEIEE